MKMYIFNCTQQVHNFSYRLPEGGRSPRMQQIQIGGYIQISGELSQPDIDAVADHHRKYGLVPMDEVDRTKAFVGLFFSVDKKPKWDKIRGTIAHNMEVLEERGRNLRMEAAVAVTNHLEANSPPGSVGALEMSVTEETRDGRLVDEPFINEGVRVEPGHKGPPAPDTSTRRERAARRRAA